jgi:hypothetical protein
MKTNIITQFKGAGHYKVVVIQNHEEIGSFNTTDMQLIDDIKEMKNGGFEQNLVMHDDFNEVIENCLNKLK